jgi:hypothetical protein
MLTKNRFRKSGRQREVADPICQNRPINESDGVPWCGLAIDPNEVSWWLCQNKQSQEFSRDLHW